MLKVFIFLNAQKEQGEPRALEVSFFFSMAPSKCALLEHAE